MRINALYGHLAEYGIVANKGPGGVTAAVAALHDAQGSLPPLARSALHGIATQRKETSCGAGGKEGSAGGRVAAGAAR